MSIYNVARSIGLGILLSVVVGLLSGLVGFSNLSFYPYFLFFVTYIPSGVMAVLWNKESPYSAAYFTGLTLSVFNLLFTLIILQFNMLISSEATFNSILLGTVSCLLAGILTVKIAPSYKREDE